MQHHYVLTLDPRAGQVFAWFLLHQHQITLDVHINRTHCWVPEGDLYTEFVLKFGDCCPLVL